jgi:hypothetical protein
MSTRSRPTASKKKKKNKKNPEKIDNHGTCPCAGSSS